MSKVVTFVIPRQPPPSLNAMQRMHWAQRMEITDTWAEEIAVAAKEAGKPQFKRAEVRLRLYYRTHRRRDADNAIGGPAKVILDGLRDAGVIPDDDTNTIRLLEPVIGVDKANPRVEIELRELDGARMDREVRQA